MKKSLFLSLIAVIALLFVFSAAAEEIVYLNDGGRGNGISSDSPVGTLEEAFDIIAYSGGKIVITVSSVNN